MQPVRKNMKKVIVTDIKYRMAISPIIELAKKGYEIIAAEFDTVKENERLGFFSKYVSCKELIRENDFCTDIENICKDYRPILIPTNRKSLMNVIANRERLSKCCDFLVPTKESINIADDKNTICSIAKKIGVPVPKTTSLAEHESIEKMADCVSFPCIIKYRNGEAMGKKPAERYTVVNNRDEFINAYTKMHSIDENPIASDYIKGHDIGVAVVMNKNHKPISFVCYESLREYPIKGGPTCYLKTIFDRKLLKYSCKLLEEIKFTGIAMLDFKGTVENPYFLEINPRIWGSAAITHLSGAPFFESYVKGACSNADVIDVETATPQYKLNTKMRFTPQSLACFIAHMKHSPNKIKILTQYAKSFFDLSVRDGLFSIKDPKPYIKYIANLIKRS